MPRMFLTALAVFAGLAGLAGLASQPASAQTLDVTGSWEHGNWRVATMLNTDQDQQICAAQTTSEFDQELSLVFYQNDDAFLEIRDVTWTYLNGDPLRFHLVVDQDEWTVIGQGWAGSMSWDLLDPQIRTKLLDRLSSGSRLDIRMPNRSRVAQFSLDGAAPAIAEVARCWAAIKAGNDYQP